MKFVVELTAKLVNELLDATSNTYPLVFFWKNKAYATDGNVVLVKPLPKTFPKKVYINREYLPRLLGGRGSIKIRIKDDFVHVRYGHNTVVKVDDPYNPTQFPDIEAMIRQEKEQEDDSLIFAVAKETLASLLRGCRDDFVVMKVRKKLTTARWKSGKGTSGYFAQASTDGE